MKSECLSNTCLNSEFNRLVVLTWLDHHLDTSKSYQTHRRMSLRSLVLTVTHKLCVKSLKRHEPYYLGRTCTQLKEGRTRRGRWMNLNNEYKNHETQLPGKIHLSHNCLYVGFDEKEYIFKE